MTKHAKNFGWDDFRLVKVIAEARGMPGAASELGISASTVFRRLGQIEEALGIDLFQRHRTGYDLTAAGAEMVSLAQRLESDITSSMRKIASQAVVPAGELRVAIDDDSLIHLLTPMFASFRRQCPDVRLDVVLMNQALNLLKRGADVIIYANGEPPGNLIGRRVARIARALYGRASDFEEADVKGSEPAAESLWVSLRDDFASLEVTQSGRQHIVPERVVYKANSVLGLAGAIESGIGIGHLPCFVGGARPGLVQLSAPQPDLATDLWMVTYPDLRQSARVRVFLDFLTEEIRRQRSLIESEGRLVARPRQVELA